MSARCRGATARTVLCVANSQFVGLYWVKRKKDQSGRNFRSLLRHREGGGMTMGEHWILLAGYISAVTAGAR